MRTDLRAAYKNIGVKGDNLLSEKTVSIVGLGSAGATTASILGREGITLRLVDKGRVEEEDMHRLSIFYEEDITKFKVKQAKARINAINPLVQVKSFHEELNENNTFLLKGDCIIDATNSDEINKVCLNHALSKKIPLIIIRYSADSAKVLVIQKKIPQKALNSASLKDIREVGVFGPLTSIAGGTAAAQALKVLLGESKSYTVDVDAWSGTSKASKL